MNAILGMLQLMAQTRPSEKQKDYLNKAKVATGALLSIINDILDFSKVEAGKMTLELQPFRIDHLLRDLAVILSASMGDKHIEVLFDIDRSAHPRDWRRLALAPDLAQPDRQCDQVHRAGPSRGYRAPASPPTRPGG